MRLYRSRFFQETVGQAPRLWSIDPAGAALIADDPEPSLRGRVVEMNQVAMLDQDFDGQVNGDPPAGWTVDPAGGATIQDDPAPGTPHGKVVRMAGGAASVFTHRSLASPVASGKVRVRAWLRSDDIKGAGLHFHLNFGASHATERAGYVSFDCDGNIYYADANSDFNLIGPFNDDTWYLVELRFDVDGQTYDIWIDGVEQVSAASWRTPGSSINRVQFDLSFSKTAYYDEVVVYESDYSTCRASFPAVESGLLRVRAQMRGRVQDGLAGDFFALSVHHSTDRAGRVYMDRDGSLYYTDADSDANLIQATSDYRYYELELLFNMRRMIYDVRLDGEWVVTGAPWEHEGGGIEGVSFELSAALYGWFGDVVIDRPGWRVYQALKMLLPPNVYSADDDALHSRELLGWACILEDALESGEDLLEELFPDTSVALIPEWENRYGLPNDASLGLLDRQARILAAQTVRPSLKTDYLKDVLEPLFGYRPEIYLRELGYGVHGDMIWEFAVIIDPAQVKDTFDYEHVKLVLEKIKPGYARAALGIHGFHLDVSSLDKDLMI